jgi:hypothetical protein
VAGGGGVASGTSRRNPGSDPFSTPARRRRLIADMSKFLLKQYCIKACRNVHVFRTETKAALILQCAVRVWMARRERRRKVMERMNREAVKINRRVRVYLAQCLLARLKKAKLLYEKNLRAIKIQCKVRQMIAKRKLRFWKKLRDEELARERERAAIVIQRAYRDFISYRWNKTMRFLYLSIHPSIYHTYILSVSLSLCLSLLTTHVLFFLREINRKRKAEEARRLRERIKAAVTLQCSYRQHLARLKLEQLKLKRFKGLFLYHILYGFKIRLNFLRKKSAAICIQRLVRNIQARFSVHTHTYTRTHT